MKVSFELSAADMRYFRERLKRARRSKSAHKEHAVIRQAAKLVTQAASSTQPEFVRIRLAKLEKLIEMLRDGEWRLEGADRSRILDALAYFADPDDLIPDRVPGLGYLDDAIMVELVVQELKHEIKAYEDFCEFRRSQARNEGEGKLEQRRVALQSRMRRRRRRDRQQLREGPTKTRSGLRLW